MILTIFLLLFIYLCITNEDNNDNISCVFLDVLAKLRSIGKVYVRKLEMKELLKAPLWLLLDLLHDLLFQFYSIIHLHLFVLCIFSCHRCKAEQSNIPNLKHHISSVCNNNNSSTISNKSTLTHLKTTTTT